MSRIGKLPIPIVSGVKVSIEESAVSVQGPKGTLAHPLPTGIQAAIRQVLSESEVRGEEVLAVGLTGHPDPLHYGPTDGPLLRPLGRHRQEGPRRGVIRAQAGLLPALLRARRSSGREGGSEGL